MKKSRNTENQYFDGQISGSKKSLCFMGFDSRKRQQMSEYYKEDKPVIIKKCSIKQSKFNNELQLLINDITEFNNSTSTFEHIIDDTVILEQLDLLPRYQKFKFTATVTKIQEPILIHINQQNRSDDARTHHCRQYSECKTSTLRTTHKYP